MIIKSFILQILNVLRHFWACIRTVFNVFGWHFLENNVKKIKPVFILVAKARNVLLFNSRNKKKTFTKCFLVKGKKCPYIHDRYWIFYGGYFKCKEDNLKRIRISRKRLRYQQHILNQFFIN